MYRTASGDSFNFQVSFLHLEKHLRYKILNENFTNRKNKSEHVIIHLMYNYECPQHYITLLAVVIRVLGEISRGRSHVQLGIDHFRNRLDFRSELLFDAVQWKSILVCDEVDCDTQVTETTRPTYAMEVSLRHFWEVEVNHNVYALDVDTYVQF